MTSPLLSSAQYHPVWSAQFFITTTQKTVERGRCNIDTGQLREQIISHLGVLCASKIFNLVTEVQILEAGFYYRAPDSSKNDFYFGVWFFLGIGICHTLLCSIIRQGINGSGFACRRDHVYSLSSEKTLG